MTSKFKSSSYFHIYIQMDHLEAFLDLEPTFKGIKTINFFDKTNLKYRNTILIDHATRTILDARVEDPEVFAKIAEKFAAETEVGEEKSFKMKKAVDAYEFVTEITTENTKLVGFYSNAGRLATDGFPEPGSQTVTYHIN